MEKHEKIEKPVKIIADLHTHTNVSSHAHSTLMEMVAAAKKCGLKAIAITNHGPNLDDGAHNWHFESYQYFIPRMIDGVIVLRGVEANILDPDGRLDVPSYITDKLDVVVGSIHTDTCFERDYDKLTNMLMNVLKDPNIDILGHLGSPLFKFDYEKIISHCNEFGKVVEINSNSSYSRVGSKENCLEIALLCKKYNVPVTLNSDAHVSFSVGSIDQALDVAIHADLDESLIINASMENLRNYFLNRRRNKMDILSFEEGQI